MATRGRRCALRLVLVAAFGLAWFGLLRLGNAGVKEIDVFVVPGTANPALRSNRVQVALAAKDEKEASPPPKAKADASSVSLVKIDDGTVKTTASILGGLAGLWVGGIGGAAIVFLLTTFVARNLDKDDTDENLRGLSKGVQGVSEVSLEALNAAGYVNDKYELTSKASGALSGLVDKLKENPGNKEVIKQIEDVAKGASKAVTDLDDEVGLKDTAGSVLTSLSELAEIGADKVQDIDKELEISSKISEKVKEVSDKVTDKK
jgi:hypothetical protein